MMQGTQKECPIVVHKETKDKKTRNIVNKNDNDLKVTGQSTNFYIPITNFMRFES